MALEIRFCPVLIGKNAKRFIWHMNNPKFLSKEVVEKMKQNYEAIIFKSKLPR
jgi:hypothetical protein